MSEAKPQDGSTVKGYRTLGPKEIEEMNQLKLSSREFCQLLDKQRGFVSAELSETGGHSVEASEAGRSSRWRVLKCRRRACGHVALLHDQKPTAKALQQAFTECL